MSKIALVFITLFGFKAYGQNPIYSTSTSTYVEGSHFHRIISLTPNKTMDLDCPTIDQDVDENDGYKMEVEKSYSGSFMYANSWWFPAQSQWAVVGLGPTASRYVIFMGKAIGEDTIKNFKKRNIPLKKDQLENWNNGDAVFWNSEGGASLGVGTGISPFHLGAKYTIKGSWAHYVEKVGPNKVFASLINRSVQSVSVSAGILYVGAGLDQIKESIKSRSYEIDIIDEAHEVAYRKFLRGDEDALKDLIAEGSTSITPIEVIRGKGNLRELAIGVATPIYPLLSWRTSTNSSNKMEHGEASWGTVRDKYWGLYSWQTKYRAVFLDYRRFKQFLAGTQFSKEPNYDTGGFNDVQTYFGSLEYIFEADHGREGRLGNQLEKFQKATGLYQYCATIPDIKSTLRYHNISHKINFSQTFIRKFLEKAATVSSDDSYLEVKVQDTVSKMIENDQKQLCGKDDVAECNDKLVKKGSKDLKDLKNKMAELGEKSINSLEMAKEFSLVGKVITQSPILYRMFYEEGKGCGMSVQFEISGRKLSRILKTEEFAESENCFL
ncbi:MAG: hypothetical protein COW01_11715 [Bdellovibrionales bacterium CG12_big_fil_rev_8_21_14_0_65_38_15]|nr:MAG: hypothetical protein COW79_11745 [Bdellovibrionales bacterium CG22_combo_CG10-13_8_21_14_all_38_13]PIQ54279.1 MAG: hypothetical protein COW01_11715 [Bdellovibrionales bacterium CG12_big_fil_rev_8_21_14_0_65_38_15]PIR29335.1 MAG: hypothetical protein COV38_11360 [Bdellovibrionales bacterium CG11_big_fil_rev_8_21_14_0_20_38_13]